MKQTDAWRTSLRHQMQTKRAKLDNTSLELSGKAILEHLADELDEKRCIAGYLAIRGELPVDSVLQHARTRNTLTAVPVVRGQTMLFVCIDEKTQFIRNRFGIREPADCTTTVLPQELDLVLVPLVAFDASGNRLGMGGGFYDRTFESNSTRPRLIGIAHSFQEVTELQAMPWDVPLDSVITERGQAVQDHARNNRQASLLDSSSQ